MKKNYTILVVDDSRASRRLIENELSEGGFQIVTADSGPHAIEIFEQQEINMITLDIEMPEMDGFETCKRIREIELLRIHGDSHGTDSFIPIIFLTSKDNYATRIKGFDAGAKEFINKQFTTGELLLVANKILYTNKTLSGSIAVVADASTTARKITASHLALHGVEITEFDNGDDVIAHLQKHGDTVDMLISDSNLDGLSGLDLCEKTRKTLGLRLPIIITTADIDRSRLMEFYQKGATDYLVKPFFKEELLARLNSHLEIRTTYKNLRRRNEELKAIGELKDRFLSVCSHDLRSPLNSIIGFTEILAEELELAPQHQRFLDNIGRSGRGLLELVNELLDFAKMQSQDKEGNHIDLNLVEICEQYIDELHILADKKRITLNFKNTSTHPHIIGNEIAIKRLLTNIGSNAVKFTPQEGRIDFSLSEQDGSLVLSLKDSGIGIPAEHLRTMSSGGTSFRRVGTEGEESTGLGLGIVREIVDIHDAKFAITSEEGAGTNIDIIFTRRPSSPSAA